MLDKRIYLWYKIYMNTLQMNFRFDDTTRERLEKLAKLENRTMTTEIEWLIDQEWYKQTGNTPSAAEPVGAEKERTS